MLRVFVADKHPNGDMIRMWGQNWGAKIVPVIADADIIQFTGGSDVSPSLYGEKTHPRTYFHTERDELESAIFLYGLKHKIPMVGICRGGQFLNVMSGGKLYQHVEKHTSVHDMLDLKTGEVISATSTHHQMFRPSEDAVRIAVAYLGGSKEYMDGDTIVHLNGNKEDPDWEVVFYEKTRSLCFQPHPEWNQNQKLTDKYFEYVEDYLIPSSE